MITLENIPDRYIVDHLFLLVGMNPLPNFVAANLLAADGGNIYLLHSAETGQVARRISNALKARHADLRHYLFEIDSADSAQIREEVRSILNRLRRRGIIDPQRSTVGLNYTGGTAAMSVHTYHVLEAQFDNTGFSYLDAGSISMRLDGLAGEQTKSIPVMDSCPVILDELTALHGLSFSSKTPAADYWTQARREILNAIHEIHLTEDGFNSWRDNYLRRGAPIEALPDPIQYAELAPYHTAIANHAGPTCTPVDVADLFGNFSRLDAYRSWFMGTWLEEYTYAVLADMSNDLGIHDLALSVEPTRRRAVSSSTESTNFELDIAAMRGHQLFVFSCQVSRASGEVRGKRVKETYKEHLLEAFVRARQLGGDEARVGLVCRYHDSRRLQAEIEESWAENRVRVFGLDELPDLGAHLRNWFETANR